MSLLSFCYFLAQFLGDQGRLAESAEMYLRYVAESPDNFELVFNAANILRQIQKNEEAEKLFIKASHLKPDVSIKTRFCKNLKNWDA